MTPAEAIAVVREALTAYDFIRKQPAFVSRALAALALIEQESTAKRESIEAAWELHKAAQERAEAAERELERIRSVPSHQRTLHLLKERERAEAAERERDDLKRRWEEDNLCGICPYRIAIQARIAQLEGALTKITEMAWTEPDDEAKTIARAALASGRGSPFPKPRMVEIGEERASGKEEA